MENVPWKYLWISHDHKIRFQVRKSNRQGVVPYASVETRVSVPKVLSWSFSFSYSSKVPPLAILLKIKLACKGRWIVLQNRIRRTGLVIGRKREVTCRISLAVQWLGLGASTAGGQGSIPYWGTKILQAEQSSQKKKKKRERSSCF